jgi:hypothetical protein
VTRDLLDALPTAFWSAYAQARREREQDQTWPSTERIREIAVAHHACPWALLAMTRGELPEFDPHALTPGPPASVRCAAGDTDAPRPVLVAPTPDTMRVLYLTATDLDAWVVDPTGRRVEPAELQAFADRWAEAIS